MYNGSIILDLLVAAYQYVTSYNLYNNYLDVHFGGRCSDGATSQAAARQPRLPVCQHGEAAAGDARRKDRPERDRQLGDTTLLTPPTDSQQTGEWTESPAGRYDSTHAVHR